MTSTTGRSTMDGKDPRRTAAGSHYQPQKFSQCARCEDVAPLGGAGARLLLAPQDRNAGRALEKVLDSAGIGFERLGPVFALHQVSRNDSELHTRLRSKMTDLLLSHVKGVFADEVTSAENLLDAFIQAEPLAALFDHLDLEWAREVLADDRLYSVYQPIVHAADGAVFAYEALIRGQMPDTGEEVGAGRLLYACERLNLQHALDQRARVAAIRGAANLDLSTAKLFVNFLPNTVYEPEVCLRGTLEAADRYGIPMERIVFEVTDTEHVQDIQPLRRIVEYYRSRGAAISLDDISSGFASVQYLADLVPDYAKVDRLLVQSAVSNASSRQTLDSIVNLAAKLGVTVIAEGVETHHEMRVCVEAGVQLLQGFLFALPSQHPQAVTMLPWQAAAA